MTECEIWKPAVGFENDVEVSSLGRVRTLDYLAPSRRVLQPTQLRRGRLLSPCPANGYHRITLKRYGRTHRIYVHKLVAEAFVSGKAAGLTVDHIDGDRLNNRAINLQWVSRAENTSRQNAAGRGVAKGELHPGAKLADADVPRLFKMREAGMSLSQIGAEFGVSASLIHKITGGLRRRHQSSAK